MGNYGPLANVQPFADAWMGTCPSCGLRAHIDQDQFQGSVSVDCPQCDYHETHDHRVQEAVETATRDWREWHDHLCQQLALRFRERNATLEAVKRMVEMRGPATDPAKERSRIAVRLREAAKNHAEILREAGEFVGTEDKAYMEGIEASARFVEGAKKEKET